MPDRDMSQAYDAASRFRRRLQEARKLGRVDTSLLDAAGTLESDLERLGADDRLIADGKAMADEVIVMFRSK